MDEKWLKQCYQPNTKWSEPHAKANKIALASHGHCAFECQYNPLIKCTHWAKGDGNGECVLYYHDKLDDPAPPLDREWMFSEQTVFAGTQLCRPCK